MLHYGYFTIIKKIFFKEKPGRCTLPTPKEAEAGVEAEPV